MQGKIFYTLVEDDILLENVWLFYNLFCFLYTPIYTKVCVIYNMQVFKNIINGF